MKRKSKFGRNEKYFFLISFIVVVVLLELGVRGLFLVLGNRGAWGYPINTNVAKPYVGFASDSYEEGKDRYGFRLHDLSNAQRDLTDKLECEFRIFLLGGSTVDGRNLVNLNDMLSARLENLLNENTTSRVRFSVINGGKGGYISIQSLMQHAFYIKYSLNPDFVIHFSGSNDFLNGTTYWPDGKYLGVEQNLHRDTEQLFTDMNRSRKLGGAINNVFRILSDYLAIVFLVHKTVNDPKAWSRSRWLNRILHHEDESTAINARSVDAWVEQHVRRYLFNIRMAIQIADADTGVAYFFQPTLLPYMMPWLSQKEIVYLGKGLDSSYTFHGYDRREAKQSYYFRVRDELRKMGNELNSDYSIVKDLSNLFDNKSVDETYFGDHVHYLPLGRKILAKEIHQAISSQIWSQITNSAKLDTCKSNR